MRLSLSRKAERTWTTASHPAVLNCSFQAKPGIRKEAQWDAKAAGVKEETNEFDAEAGILRESLSSSTTLHFITDANITLNAGSYHDSDRAKTATDNTRIFFCNHTKPLRAVRRATGLGATGLESLATTLLPVLASSSKILHPWVL